MTVNPDHTEKMIITVDLGNNEAVIAEIRYDIKGLFRDGPKMLETMLDESFTPVIEAVRDRLGKMVIAYGIAQLPDELREPVMESLRTDDYQQAYSEAKKILKHQMEEHLKECTTCATRVKADEN